MFNAQMTSIGSKKWRNFQKKNYSPKSVFGVATMTCNSYCYTTWYGIKQIFNACLWKRILYCLYAQPKFVFCSYRTRITSRTTTNKTPHLINRRNIWQTNTPIKMLGWTEFWNSLCNMWACIILLKVFFRNALKKENDFRKQ